MPLDLAPVEVGHVPDERPANRIQRTPSGIKKEAGILKNSEVRDSALKLQASARLVAGSLAAVNVTAISRYIAVN